MRLSPAAWHRRAHTCRMFEVRIRPAFLEQPSMRTHLLFLLVITVATHHGVAAAQSVAGALVGIVKDAQDEVVRDAVVRLTSRGAAGLQTQRTDAFGQLRFPALPPGQYVLDIEAPGFAPYHEEPIRVGVGATLERTVVLHVAGVRESSLRRLGLAARGPA